MRYSNSTFKQIDTHPIVFFNENELGTVYIQTVIDNQYLPHFKENDKIISIVSYNNIEDLQLAIKVDNIINAILTIFNKNKHPIYIYHKNQYNIQDNIKSFETRLKVYNSIISKINKQYTIFLR